MGEGNGTVPYVGPGMIARHCLVSAEKVVIVKGILEAHEGLAQVYSQKGGTLVIAAPVDRSEELDGVLASLVLEIPTFTLLG